MSDHQRDAEFTAFVRASSASLARTAWFLTGDAELAADLVQEAYVKTYLAWRRVRREDAAAYARKVLVNLNIDRWRRRHPETVGNVPEGLVASPEASVGERDRIARMLAGLPQQQRAVVVLRYLDDLSEQATAAHLGISVGAVKSAASRGLATLRAHHVPEGEPR